MVPKVRTYKRYLKDQITRAESKWARKWDYDEIFKQQLNFSIDEVWEYIKNSKDICCMGCRSGTEVFEFKERFPKAEVWGVDITDRIATIRTHLEVTFGKQDFNKLPDKWGDKFDLIFSNSLDHAYEPAKTILEWRRVCRGYLLLELSTTADNRIEYSFKKTDLKVLFPQGKFKKIMGWDSPERNIFTVLYEVIK